MEWLLWRRRYLRCPATAPFLLRLRVRCRWLGKRRGERHLRGGTPAPGPTPRRADERTVAPAPSPPQPLAVFVRLNSFDRTYFLVHSRSLRVADNSGTGIPTSSSSSEQHKTTVGNRGTRHSDSIASHSLWSVDRGRSAGSSGMMHLADMWLRARSASLPWQVVLLLELPAEACRRYGSGSGAVGLLGSEQSSSPKCHLKTAGSSDHISVAATLALRHTRSCPELAGVDRGPLFHRHSRSPDLKADLLAA
jgi:hypothetical protein